MSPELIGEKYGWSRQTVYNWLNRFEERDFEDALYDDDRPGKPPDFSEQQFQQLAETLHQPPEEAGYDPPAWTTALAQQHLIKEFDVSYFRRHVQRLMNKAEVSARKPRPEPSAADQEELHEYDEDLKNSRETGHRNNGHND